MADHGSVSSVLCGSAEVRTISYASSKLALCYPQDLLFFGWCGFMVRPGICAPLEALPSLKDVLKGSSKPAVNLAESNDSDTTRTFRFVLGRRLSSRH